MRRLMPMVSAIALAAGLVPGASAPVAAAAQLTALFADGAGGLTMGRGTYITSPAVTFTATLSPDGNAVEVKTSDGVSSDNAWDIQLAAPAGSALHLGNYTAASYPQGAGAPLLYLFRGGMSCSPMDGQFWIDALAKDGGGSLTELAARIELQHCGSFSQSTYLDIRINSTTPLRAVVLTPQSAGLPATLTGTASADTPITVTSVGNAAATISSVATDAPDFAVGSDACTGVVLAPGDACQVGVELTPTETGWRYGNLVVDDDTFPAEHAASLSGQGVGYQLSPLTINFPATKLYQTSSAVITLRNGLSTLALTTPTVGFDEFKVRPNSGCTSLAELAPGTSCDLTVDYTPKSVGNPWAELDWYLAFIPNAVNLYGHAVPLSNVTWTSVHIVRNSAWNAGNALARTTDSSHAYLHTVLVSDYFGSKYATDTGPYVGVFYRRSTNGGSTFATAVRLNPTNRHGDRAALAASGSRVYVAWVSITHWVHFSKTAPRVIWIRSAGSNGSGSWSTAKALSPSSGRVDGPTVAASGANVYVAYTDAATGAVKVAVSHNRGSTWSTKTLGSTTNSASDGRSGRPQVAANGAQVVVSWIGSAAGAVVASVSGNSGGTWSRSTLSASSESFTAAAATTGKLSAAWMAADGLHLRSWTAAGGWAVATVAPTPGPAKSYAWFTTPAIAWYGTARVGVAFGGCSGGCASTNPRIDLFWAESADAGATFPARQLINHGSSVGSAFEVNADPSIVFASPTTRYLMSAPFTWGGSYQVRVRTGLGTP